MQVTTEELIARLSEIDPNAKDSSEVVAMLYDVVDDAEQLPDQSKLLLPIFEFLEKWPEADLGAPGPLVHFVERFILSGYDEQLLRSLARQPVPSTVWMVNRMLNSEKVTGDLRARLFSALEKSVEHPRSGYAARESAKEFLECQRASRPRG